MTFADIDQARRAAGLSVLALCAASGVAYPTYWRAATGQGVARPSTLRRLRAGLTAPPQAKPPVNEALTAYAYRGFLAAYAQAAGVDLEAVLASEPKRRANSNALWREAARLRALAVYSTAKKFDLRGARLAAAIGLTRQAVSLMFRRVEDMRDDPDIDALIERAGRMLSGRQE